MCFGGGASVPRGPQSTPRVSAAHDGVDNVPAPRARPRRSAQRFVAAAAAAAAVVVATAAVVDVAAAHARRRRAAAAAAAAVAAAVAAAAAAVLLLLLAAAKNARHRGGRAARPLRRSPPGRSTSCRPRWPSGTARTAPAAESRQLVVGAGDKILYEEENVTQCAYTACAASPCACRRRAAARHRGERGRRRPTRTSASRGPTTRWQRPDTAVQPTFSSRQYHTHSAQRYLHTVNKGVKRCPH